MSERMWLAEELEKARTMRDCFKKALEEVLEFSNDPAVIRIAREALGTKTAPSDGPGYCPRCDKVFQSKQEHVRWLRWAQDAPLTPETRSRVGTRGGTANGERE